jgi:hypothetical protein
MSTLTAVAAGRIMLFARRLALPVLVLETVGLLELIASWLVAAVAAIVLVLVIGTVAALRRASRNVDTILREELTTSPMVATDGDPASLSPADVAACSSLGAGVFSAPAGPSSTHQAT